MGDDDMYSAAQFVTSRAYIVLNFNAYFAQSATFHPNCPTFSVVEIDLPMLHRFPIASYVAL